VQRSWAILTPDFTRFVGSPLGAIPKKHLTPPCFWVIHDISWPPGCSVNDFISPGKFFCQYFFNIQYFCQYFFGAWSVLALFLCYTDALAFVMVDRGASVIWLYLDDFFMCGPASPPPIVNIISTSWSLPVSYRTLPSTPTNFFIQLQARNQDFMWGGGGGGGQKRT